MIRALMAGWTIVLLARLACGAEAVYHNGKVVTQWSGRPIAEAFLVDGNRFLKVGSNSAVLAAAKPGAKRVDLQGRTVLPGLNDSHTHPIGAALSEFDGPVPVMKSIVAVQAYLKRLAAQTNRGNVLFVPKVYSTRLVEQRYPTRYELDQAVGDREAMTDNGYASVLNSALLKRLNINRDTPQPTNGKIIKDDKAEPTGLILGAGQLLGPLRASRAFSDAERLKALKTMQAAYNRVGITSTIDRGQRADGFRTYQELKRRGETTVRTAVTYLVNAEGKTADVRRTIENIPFVTGWGDSWLQVGALKTIVDGGILIGTAYLREPYGRNTGVYGYLDPEYRGVLNVPPENLTEMAKTASRLGWQMTAHTTGGGAIDALLHAYEAADQESPIRARRFTVTHGNFPNAEAIARAKRLGVAFDCQPQWHHFDGPVLDGVFGPERTKWFLPLRSMLDAGLVVAGGSDHMIRNNPRDAINAYHPFFAMWMTITRKMADGRVLGPEQRITRLEALRMWTLAGAWLTFEENIKGSIEPGKLADFVVITKDYLTVPEDEIKDIEALVTVVDGRVVHGDEAALK
ncbi:MAG: amidohydrolase [Acidobacteria bacterium]|nr:amidohydrolase [Acidobacteriota bacterium]MCI0721713.1 amidohydrolase [Acidobacteriota bacterium]